MEYPKCLYKGNVIYSDYVIVKDPQEEEQANENGFGVEIEEAPPADSMSIAQLRAALAEKGVSLPSGYVKRADLQAMLDKANEGA